MRDWTDIWTQLKCISRDQISTQTMVSFIHGFWHLQGVLGMVFLQMLMSGLMSFCFYNIHILFCKEAVLFIKVPNLIVWMFLHLNSDVMSVWGKCTTFGPFLNKCSPFSFPTVTLLYATSYSTITYYLYSELMKPRMPGECFSLLFE